MSNNKHLEANCFRGHKRRKGFPSKTHVKRGDRVVGEYNKFL
jgi:hypothetical protein